MALLKKKPRQARLLDSVGVAAWYADTRYGTGAIVKGSDGNLYRGRAPNLSVAPTLTTADDGKWELFHATADFTVNVAASGARFTSVAEALSFLRNGRIGQAATATIQIANGTYDLTTNTVTVDHPSRNRIVIRGDPTTPANVVLKWSGNTTGFLLTGTGGECTFKGMTLIGNADADLPYPGHAGVTSWTPIARPYGNAAANGDGIGCYHGGEARLEDCVVKKFLHGISAWYSKAHVHCLRVDGFNCWDSALFAYQGSSFYSESSRWHHNGSSHTGITTGLGYGIIGEDAGGICQSSEIDHNLVAGVLTNNANGGVYEQNNFHDNPAAFLRKLGGAMELYDNTFSGNDITVIDFPGWCWKWGTVTSGNAMDVFAHSTIADGRVFYQSPPADGNKVEFPVFFQETGIYRCHTIGISGNNVGIVDWRVTTPGAVTTVVKSGQDRYLASEVRNIIMSFDFAVTAIGTHTIEARINGKNGSSSDYYHTISKMWFERIG
jgi:hypothetical protein